MRVYESLFAYVTGHKQKNPKVAKGTFMLLNTDKFRLDDVFGFMETMIYNISAVESVLFSEKVDYVVR